MMKSTLVQESDSLSTPSDNTPNPEQSLLGKFYGNCFIVKPIALNED